MISLPGHAVANIACQQVTDWSVYPSLVRRLPLPSPLSKVLNLRPQQQECHGLQMGPGGRP